jgi:hypothetical protein
MNYTYELKMNNYPSQSYPLSLTPQNEVIEYLDHIFIEAWNMIILNNNSIESKSLTNETKKSFIRTKEWLIENHPELLI